ncbi:hypothetical protein [Shewanella woodyi]|uniref:hypothetical protein n=1 Tax=Shewanella woodyi TaxID=60961 RepID=UPI00374A4D9D
MKKDLLSLIEDIRYLSPELALEKLESASSSMMEDSDWLFLTACFQADNEHFSDAKRSFFTLLDKNPDNELARIQLACIHLSLGELKHILYLLCPYLVWQKSSTCTAFLAHALLSFAQNDGKKVQQYLAEAKEAEDANNLQVIIQKIDELLVKGFVDMEEKSVSVEESKQNTTSHLLNNLYKKSIEVPVYMGNR